jgi:plasmid replication initiation protein
MVAYIDICMRYGIIILRGVNMEKNYIVTKSNKLINCDYDLSVFEQKIILTLASMVEPQDTEFKEYEFKIKDFIKLLGLKDQSKYTEIPKITRELMKKVFEIREGNDILQLSWLSSARYKTGKGTVILKFDSNLKPYMLGLKEFYTSYKLANVLILKSKYSIRLYEILKSNLFKNCIEIELEELKSMVGAKAEYFKVYADFKRKVILQARKELKEKTDINFDFEEVKTGRKTTSIKFIINSNGKAIHEIAATSEMTIINEIKTTEKSLVDLIKQVQAICCNHKITDHEASCILSDANNNIGLIKERYNYLLTQKKVDNVVGYMRSIIVTYDKAQKNIKIDNFNNYEQREYDFEKLEKNLTAWK